MAQRLSTYDKYKLYTEYLNKVEELHRWYDENIAHQYYKATVTDDTTDEELDEIMATRDKAEDAWIKLEYALNDMCFEIVDVEHAEEHTASTQIHIIVE